MQIKYSCSYWGNDHLTPKEFIEKVHLSGYNGAELFLQPPDKLTDEFTEAIEAIRKKDPDFYLIAMQIIFPVKESVDSYIQKMEKMLESIAALNPLFINAHTGKDYFSFDDNCRVIEASLNFSKKNNIRVLHETHRGRFSFHAASLLPYLEKFPELELVADFSHFCTVSESMLEDQLEIIHKIIPHVGHVHARIGFEQGPQVNHPAAPEWQRHLERFMEWWEEIVKHHQTKNSNCLTFTPEFGPVPYMPVEPFSQKPLSNVWENNIFILEKLKEKFTPSIP